MSGNPEALCPYERKESGFFPEIIKHGDRRATFVLGFHIPGFDFLRDAGIQRFSLQIIVNVVVSDA